MAHGEALYSAPPLETGARHVKVGRGGYSRTNVASCASVVRGPRRTIEVEEGTSSSLLASRIFRHALPRASSQSPYSTSSSISALLPQDLSDEDPSNRIIVRQSQEEFVVRAKISFCEVVTSATS